MKQGAQVRSSCHTLVGNQAHTNFTCGACSNVGIARAPRNGVHMTQS